MPERKADVLKMNNRGLYGFTLWLTELSSELVAALITIVTIAK